MAIVCIIFLGGCAGMVGCCFSHLRGISFKYLFSGILHVNFPLPALLWLPIIPADKGAVFKIFFVVADIFSQSAGLVIYNLGRVISFSCFAMVAAFLTAGLTCN